MSPFEDAFSLAVAFVRVNYRRLYKGPALSINSPAMPPAPNISGRDRSRRVSMLVLALLALALALRLAHLSSALASPLSYQLAPDEGYYLTFGKAVAAGRGTDSPEFTSLDPGYGYLLGAAFKLFGANLFAVFVLQALLDTATAYGLIVIGRLLGRERAGLYGAAVYGLTSTAIMYSAALLKEIWVASFVTWWVAAALKLARSERIAPWFWFGAYCGLGVALRANLLLLGLLALLLPVGASWPQRRYRRWAASAALLAVGMAAALAPWSIRNASLHAGISPLPHNGGISLHQVYNADNPSGEFWIPPFVSYLNPGEIWRGYAAEAQARAGHALTPAEVDRYWRDRALEYVRREPARVAGVILRKALGFLSSEEIPDNRSTYEERLFSPIMRLLPRPTVALLALGLAGLAALAARDRRWPIVAAPIFAAWITVAVFFDADRFRFHAATMLALCAGVWLDGIQQSVRAKRWRALARLAAPAAALAIISVLLGFGKAPPAVRWDQIAWGYIKMGKIDEARAVAERETRLEPSNGDIWEALGFTAIERRQFDEAASDYRHAIELKPRSHVGHYNLAKVYLALGDRERAAAEARRALELDPLPEYRALAEQIERGR
ncbi:MAG TPA: tetratricopeptide repeat protein [Steroidobacteraceae bacterium]|jgi:tetratricopeptide (TPR) repeat protein|nr:tetratricopeptide repeat protein [Steroidobacteraceae bacterium]